MKFSGFIKTEALVNGYAGLWWRIDGPNGSLGMDNMGDRGPQGTTDWTRFEIEIPVAADARNINFGVSPAAASRACVSDEPQHRGRRQLASRSGRSWSLTSTARARPTDGPARRRGISSGQRKTAG